MPSKDIHSAGFAMLTLISIILFLTLDHIFFLFLISLCIIGLSAITLQKEIEERSTAENRYE